MIRLFSQNRRRECPKKARTKKGQQQKSPKTTFKKIGGIREKFNALMKVQEPRKTSKKSNLKSASQKNNGKQAGKKMLLKKWAIKNKTKLKGNAFFLKSKISSPYLTQPNNLCHPISNKGCCAPTFFCIEYFENNPPAPPHRHTYKHAPNCYKYTLFLHFCKIVKLENPIS